MLPNHKVIKVISPFKDLADREVELWTPKGTRQDVYITARKDEYPYNKIYKNMMAYSFSDSVAE